MTITIPEFDVFEVLMFTSTISYFLVVTLSWLIVCVGISVGGETFTKFINKIKWLFCVSLVVSPGGLVKCFQNLHPVIAIAMFMCSVFGCLLISFPRD